jgi:hypothetical protein
MNANTTAAHLITDEEFRAEFNRLEREKRIAEVREQNRRSAYNGKVWFNKERDDYGRTIRVVKTMEDGVSRTMGVVVCVPRWTPDLKAKGITRYFTNDYSITEGHPTENGAVVNHDTLKAALARFGCGSKEYELYTK